jgi:hypothetical protein
MPLMLNVGLTRKVGLPNYSSVGAACHVEFELDAQVLNSDPEALQAKARVAFAACARAVDEELARHKPLSPDTHRASEPVTVACNGTARHERASQPLGSCSSSQVRALRAISRSRGLDLDALVGERFTVERAEELSRAEASCLIGELQVAARATA